jgi:multiple sugar transport system substrate-binding protein/sn-glycerol 3-phosphate transport system substrate-binding protein
LFINTIQNDQRSQVQTNLTSFWGRAFWYLLVLALLFLAACSSPTPPVSTATLVTPTITPSATKTVALPTSTVTITPSPTSSLGVDRTGLNGIQITFWHPWSGETGNMVEDLVAQFNSGNEFGISVESIYQGNINSLNERIAEPDAELPGLTLGSGAQISSWIAQSKPVVDMDAYLNDPMWGLTPPEQADFLPIFLEQDISAQNLIGFPAARSSQLMFYNTSWARELGFSTPPATPAEFLEQACAAAQENAAIEDSTVQGRGGWLINNTPSAVLSWLYAFDAPVILPDGGGYSFNNPPTEAVLVFLKELLDQGCAWEALDSPPEAEFAQRNALFITSSLTDLDFQSGEFNRFANSDDWTVIGFPSPQGHAVISAYGPSFAMFAGSPEENLAAWLFVKWFTLPEQQATFVTTHGSFPTRVSTMEFLSDFARENPQWVAAQDLLANIRPEPNLPSWNVVRWVLGDVGTQIFRYYFTPERIPATLELMDETAAELHERTQ